MERRWWWMFFSPSWVISTADPDKTPLLKRKERENWQALDELPLAMCARVLQPVKIKVHSLSVHLLLAESLLSLIVFISLTPLISYFCSLWPVTFSVLLALTSREPRNHTEVAIKQSMQICHSVCLASSTLTSTTCTLLAALRRKYWWEKAELNTAHLTTDSSIQRTNNHNPFYEGRHMNH